MIKILNSNSEWNKLLIDIEAQDVFFSQEYYKINEPIFNGKTECFCYENNKVKILYPYIKRSIRESEYCDISSAYGHGGYIGYPRNEGIIEFRNAFHRYCLENGIVSEFIRFHPLYGNHCLGVNENGVIENWQPVVVADVSSNIDLIRKMVKVKAREKIRKADRNLIKVYEHNEEYYYEKFVILYYKTMERLQASNFYYFSNEFFLSMVRELNRYSKLFLAWLDDKVVGGLLVLFGKDFSYNFLSCSNAHYQNLGIKDLLQWKVLEWSHFAGKQKHLLGGGRRGEDSLFQFKEKFSPKKENYYIGKVIHIPTVYSELCKKRGLSFYPKNGEFDSGSWFPFYRQINEIDTIL